MAEVSNNVVNVANVTPQKKRGRLDDSSSSLSDSPVAKAFRLDDSAGSPSSSPPSSTSTPNRDVVQASQDAYFEEVVRPEEKMVNLSYAAVLSGNPLNEPLQTRPTPSPQTESPAFEETMEEVTRGPRVSPVHELATWITVVITTIGSTFPKDRAAEVAARFRDYIGRDRCVPLNRLTDAISFKIRKDLFTRAQNFRFGTFDWEVKEQHKRITGILRLKPNQSAEQTMKTLKSKNNIDEVRLTRNKASIAIKFNEPSLPLTVNGNIITPALGKEVRCHNCQKFGHFITQCTFDTACPHCAGNHTSKNCPDRSIKKCANCQNAHSAAYKGCEHYLNYSLKLRKSNSIKQKEFNTKCQTQGIKPPSVALFHNNQPKISQELLIEIATMAQNKPYEEVLKIMADKLKIRINLTNSQPSQNSEQGPKKNKRRRYRKNNKKNTQSTSPSQSSQAHQTSPPATQIEDPSTSQTSQPSQQGCQSQSQNNKIGSNQGQRKPQQKRGLTPQQFNDDGDYAWYQGDDSTPAGWYPVFKRKNVSSRKHSGPHKGSPQRQYNN